MSGFLRFLMGALAFVYLQAGVLLSVLLLLQHRRAGFVPAEPVIIGGVTIVAVASMVAGARFGYFDLDRAALRRQVAVLAGLTAAGVVVELSAVALGAPVLLVVLLAIGGIAVAAGAPALGRAARRRERLRPIDDPVERVIAAVDRAWRFLALGFGIGLGAGLLAFVILVTIGIPATVFGSFALTCSAFPFLGAALGGIVVQLRVNPVFRAAVGTDLTRMRRIARFVLRRKGGPLSEDERTLAVSYARLIGPVMRLQLVTYGALYIGLLLNTVHLAADEHRFDPVPWVTLVGLPVVFVGLGAVLLVRIRRANAYARTAAVA